MRFRKTPTSDELNQELKREQYKTKYRRTLTSTVFVLITAAAAAVLVATLWLPVLRIYGASMSPTLKEGETVVSVKNGSYETITSLTAGSASYETGDVIAFYYGNKLLVKRYIAGPGSWVDIQEDGTVTVDGVTLDEPYLQEKAVGYCDLTLPYQVPEGKYFLMGDQRATSVDSRHSSVGCIAEDEIVGKIIFRIWPWESIGWIS